MLARQLKQLSNSKELVENGIRYVPTETLTEIHAEIDGPPGTPYEGGTFRLKLILGSEYPSAPPKGAYGAMCCRRRTVTWPRAVPASNCAVRVFEFETWSPTAYIQQPSCPLFWPAGFFLTKIFHPNVANSGDICVNTLKKDWKPECTLAHVLQVIRCLLIVPFPESSLNDDAGKLFMESYDEYHRKAKLMTGIHASSGKAAAATSTAGSLTVTSSSAGAAAEPAPATASNSSAASSGLAASASKANILNVAEPTVGKKTVAATSGVDQKKKTLKRL